MVNNPVEVDEAAVWALKFFRIGEKSVRWEVGVFAFDAQQSCVTIRSPTRLLIGSLAVQHPFPKEFDAQSSHCLRPTDS